MIFIEKNCIYIFVNFLKKKQAWLASNQGENLLKQNNKTPIFIRSNRSHKLVTKTTKKTMILIEKKKRDAFKEKDQIL